MAKTADRKLAIARRIHDLVGEPVRHARPRPDLRPADVHARLGRRGVPAGRHRDARSHPAHQDRAARRQDAARRQQHLVRALPGRTPRAEQRLPPLCDRGRARHGHRARGARSCRSTRSTNAGASSAGSSSSTNGSSRRCTGRAPANGAQEARLRSAHGADGVLRRPEDGEEEPNGPCRNRRRTAEEPDHRRRPRGAAAGPGRGPQDVLCARDHQLRSCSTG